MAVVLVTGGSRGIGRAAVEAFAARGDQVFFLYEKAVDAAREVEKSTGAVGIRCDVSDGKAVRKAAETVGAVDILVCNAGICFSGLMQDMPEEKWDRQFDVNVKGIYHCVNAFLPGFLAKQAGSIVTVSSMWGQVGASCEVGYSATKGAVIAMTKALAQELGPSGIRVNCVAPGVVLTDMCANVDPETMNELASQASLGRNGTPQDIAKAILYLADAPFVTGQVLGVNGGLIY